MSTTTSTTITTMPTNPLPKPPSPPLLQNFPPASIPNSHPNPSKSSSLPLPTTWRCGTCTALHPVQTLLHLPPPPPQEELEHNSHNTCCSTPALQAVYDQFGALYLFWRDDPAVSDLRVPRMAEEARWRVWMAGGGEEGQWEGGMGMEWEGVGKGGRVGRGMS